MGKTLASAALDAWMPGLSKMFGLGGSEDPFKEYFEELMENIETQGRQTRELIADFWDWAQRVENSHISADFETTQFMMETWSAMTLEQRVVSDRCEEISRIHEDYQRLISTIKWSPDPQMRTKRLQLAATVMGLALLVAEEEARCRVINTLYEDQNPKNERLSTWWASYPYKNEANAEVFRLTQSFRETLITRFFGFVNGMADGVLEEGQPGITDFESIRNVTFWPEVWDDSEPTFRRWSNSRDVYTVFAYYYFPPLLANWRGKGVEVDTKALHHCTGTATETQSADESCGRYFIEGGGYTMPHQLWLGSFDTERDFSSAKEIWATHRDEVLQYFYLTMYEPVRLLMDEWWNSIRPGTLRELNTMDKFVLAYYGKDAADYDGDGVPNVNDNCPAVANESQTNSDKDLFGDVCDNCPLKTNGNQIDIDFDEFGDECDNCPYEFNLDQSDTNRNGVGDLCETLPGVEVCGRVIDWKKISETSSKWGVFEFGSTPDEIEVPYCAVGRAVNPATGGTALLDQSGQHDVQLRWCSCEGSANETDCRLGTGAKCFENRKGEEVRQFKHEGWHLSTYGTSSGFTTSATIWPAPKAGTCAAGSTKYYPSTSCRYDAAWSAWGQDEQSNFCTYHCAPPKPVMKNPLLTGVKNMGKIQWQWRKELWWKNLVGTSSAPDARAEEVLKGKAFGRLWLRPQGPEAGGPAWDKGNHYVGFKLDPGSSRSTSLGYALPVKPNPTDSVCSLVSCGGIRGPSADDRVNWPDQVVKP